LKEGELFGEVALVTNLRRTASVMADDYSFCSYMPESDVR
jgi:hypothetical protein